MEYIEEIQEQVILVGVQLDENDNVKESLDELEELADTAGAQTVPGEIYNAQLPGAEPQVFTSRVGE